MVARESAGQTFIGTVIGNAHPAEVQLQKGRVHNGRDLRSESARANVVRQLRSGSIPFLFEHGTQDGFGPDKPIGRVVGARQTHAGGIEVEMKLGPVGCAEAERAAKMLRDKTHTELSLAHAYEQLDPTQNAGDGEYRHDVLEVSLVKEGGRRDCMVSRWTENETLTVGGERGYVAASALTTHGKDCRDAAGGTGDAGGIENHCYKGASAKPIADCGVVYGSLRMTTELTEMDGAGTVVAAESAAAPEAGGNESQGSAAPETGADAPVSDALPAEAVPPAPVAVSEGVEPAAAAGDPASHDADLTADIQKICEIARQQQAQLAEVQRQLAAEQAQTAKMMAAEQAQRAQLLAASKRAAKDTLHELQKKINSTTVASPTAEAAADAVAAQPATESMEVDQSVVAGSLRHIKDLEEKLQKSQSALKRFVDPQKANMNGTVPAHAAKRQKLDSAPQLAADRSERSATKAIADHGVVTASRLGYEEETGDICAVRDESIRAVKEGKLHLREFNHKMAQLHSSAGLQDADGGIVRANSDRYRADGTPGGPLGLEFGYNMRDQNPAMCARLQEMINQRSARDLMKGSETMLHYTQRGAQSHVY